MQLADKVKVTEVGLSYINPVMCTPEPYVSTMLPGSL